MVKGPAPRKYAFFGRISHAPSPEKGFIRLGDIWRSDGGNLGIRLDDDVFVHINAFATMRDYGHSIPERLEVGMVIAFFIGPSIKEDGRVTAECCSVHYGE